MRTQLKVFGVLLAAALWGAAPALVNAEPADSATEPQKKLGPPPDKQTAAKVNAYIDVMNNENEQLFSQQREWLSVIDPKVGPTCKEQISIRQEIGPKDGRYDVYRKRLKAKPALPADAAALRMVDAVEELHDLGRGPGPYNSYQGKDGSWCKRLKEVFPQVLAIFQKYSASEAEVRAHVERFTDERDERDAQAALKKYGRNYRYAFARMVLDGKIMMRGLHAEMAKHSPDPNVVRDLFTAYLTLGEEMKAKMDVDVHAKVELFPHVFRFFLIESLPKIKRGRDALLESLSAPPEKRRAERNERAFSQVISAYNEIIGYMNQVKFDPNMK